MTTHTHTRKWDKITRWALTAFVIGLIGRMAAGLSDTADGLAFAFTLLTVAGLVVSLVGSVKAYGGLKTGITAFVTGLIAYVVGKALIESAPASMYLGAKFPDMSDPKYIIGSPLETYGWVLLIVGGIMAAASYLRRVLRAVENKATASN